MCESITKKEIILGIAICGSGIGMSIACNKVKGIRCAKINDALDAKLCREHNNANVIALKSNLCMFEVKDILDNFLKTPFSNETRHINRINKITEYEAYNER